MYMFIYVYGSIGLRGCLNIDTSEPVQLYMYSNTHAHRHTHLEFVPFVFSLFFNCSPNILPIDLHIRLKLRSDPFNLF